MDQPLGRIALVVRFKVPSKARFSVGGFETFKAGEKKSLCVRLHAGHRNTDCVCSG